MYGFNRARLKAKAVASGVTSQPPANGPTVETKRTNSREMDKEPNENVYGPVKDDFVRQPFKNADQALKDGLNLISQEDWYSILVVSGFSTRVCLYLLETL